LECREENLTAARHFLNRGKIFPKKDDLDLYSGKNALFYKAQQKQDFSNVLKRVYQ